MMKLWRVYNGEVENDSNFPLFVIVLAETEKRALELASERFKKDAESLRHDGTYRELPTYWTELEAKLECADVTREWTSKVDC